MRDCLLVVLTVGWKDEKRAVLKVEKLVDNLADKRADKRADHLAVSMAGRWAEWKVASMAG